MVDNGEPGSANQLPTNVCRLAAAYRSTGQIMSLGVELMTAMHSTYAKLRRKLGRNAVEEVIFAVVVISKQV